MKATTGAPKSDHKAGDEDAPSTDRMMMKG